MDEYVTPVVFRVERTKTRELTAVFPTLPATYYGYDMVCYVHVGQHGACGYDWYNKTRAAKPQEYAALAKELAGLGYKLKIYQRINPKHRAAFQEAQAKFRR